MTINQAKALMVSFFFCMIAVLLVLDVCQLFYTPLSTHQMNHWLPEWVAVCLAAHIIERKGKPHKFNILFIVFCPVLVYSVLGNIALGFGATFVFLGAYLVGLGSVRDKEGEKNEE